MLRNRASLCQNGETLMTTMVHGSAVAIGSLGVLIVGPSGSGKSDLVLRLIDRGAKLISDDILHIDSADGGPHDTVAVGSYPAGDGPYGLHDGAGLVFEWTATPAGNDRSGNGRYIVKGGSWDDRGCGVCRPAARHGRPAALRHILIGFRLVSTPPE